jgi:predicted dehydrogenase
VRERLHYDWHWFWDTGNGEIGNQGIHEVDAARWALGQPLAAERIMSFGGRYAWDDDGQTPNVQVSIFDYKPAPLIFEVNNLPVDPPGNRAFANRSVVVGIIIQCEGGYYAGKHGGSIFDNDGKEITKIEGGGSDNHMKNFIDAMRAGRPQDVTAPVIEGHLSSTLHHAANASYRMGRDGDPERVRAAIKGDTDGNASLDRVLELLARHENVDLRRQPLQLGPWLTFDPKRERYTGALAEEANATLGRDYRAPYVVPERV